MSNWHLQTIADVVTELDTDTITGLADREAQDRLVRYGPNELIERGGKHPLRILWQQFTSTMVLILIAAAVVSGLLGKATETIAIAAIVVLFALLGFVQEYRAEQAMAALKKLAVPIVRVVRGGDHEDEHHRAGELLPQDAQRVLAAALDQLVGANLLAPPGGLVVAQAAVGIDVQFAQDRFNGLGVPNCHSRFVLSPVLPLLDGSGPSADIIKHRQ